MLKVISKAFEGLTEFLMTFAPYQKLIQCDKELFMDLWYVQCVLWEDSLAIAVFNDEMFDRMRKVR